MGFLSPLVMSTCFYYTWTVKFQKDQWNFSLPLQPEAIRHSMSTNNCKPYDCFKPHNCCHCTLLRSQYHLTVCVRMLVQWTSGSSHYEVHRQWIVDWHDNYGKRWLNWSIYSSWFSPGCLYVCIDLHRGLSGGFTDNWHISLPGYIDLIQTFLHVIVCDILFVDINVGG
jgi:hypothetical protein